MQAGESLNGKGIFSIANPAFERALRRVAKSIWQVVVRACLDDPRSRSVSAFPVIVKESWVLCDVKTYVMNRFHVSPLEDAEINMVSRPSAECGSSAWADSPCLIHSQSAPQPSALSSTSLNQMNGMVSVSSTTDTVSLRMRYDALPRLVYWIGSIVAVTRESSQSAL